MEFTVGVGVRHGAGRDGAGRGGVWGRGRMGRCGDTMVRFFLLCLGKSASVRLVTYFFSPLHISLPGGLVLATSRKTQDKGHILELHSTTCMVHLYENRTQ